MTAYRYLLTRDFRTLENDPARTALFIMLNPSTADEFDDDPTIRRCVSFAKREGCSRLEVVNLYAMRATKPERLLTVSARAALGPKNKRTILNALDRGPAVAIAAWGAWWDTQSKRVTGPGFARLAVESFAREREITLHCFGTTKSGAPRHPLYVRADQPLIPFAAEWKATP